MDDAPDRHTGFHESERGRGGLRSTRQSACVRPRSRREADGSTSRLRRRFAWRVDGTTLATPWSARIHSSRAPSWPRQAWQAGLRRRGSRRCRDGWCRLLLLNPRVRNDRDDPVSNRRQPSSGVKIALAIICVGETSAIVGLLDGSVVAAIYGAACGALAFAFGLVVYQRYLERDRQTTEAATDGPDSQRHRPALVIRVLLVVVLLTGLGVTAALGGRSVQLVMAIGLTVLAASLAAVWWLHGRSSLES